MTWRIVIPRPPIPTHHGGEDMNDRFKEYVESLPPLFNELMFMSPVKIENLPSKLPQECVYLFSEGGHHFYVGRSNRFRQRLRNHSTPSAKENQAAFAFRLAQEESGQKRIGSRRDMLENPKFAPASATGDGRRTVFGDGTRTHLSFRLLFTSL